MRHSTAALWRLIKPESVKISKFMVVYAAADIAKEKLKTPDWLLPGELPFSHRAFPSHALYINAINFCFARPGGTRFAVSDKFVGSSAAAACFYRALGERPIDADEITNIAASIRISREFFKGTPEIPLLQARRNNLLEVARVLKKKFAGNPLNILSAAGYDAGRAVKILCREFPQTFGLDKYIFELPSGRWLTLRFYKRAQLWALMYQGRALNSGGELKPLDNMEKVGPIIDCAIPAALRQWRILEYRRDLEKDIENGVELPSGSKRELEIRLGAKYAIELLLAALQRGKKVTMVELDNYLWSMGKTLQSAPQSCAIQTYKYHYTKTTAY